MENLQALITALDAAGNRKNTGLGSRIGKGAALDAEVRIGMNHVRKLDAILSQPYEGDVELYAAWKAAKRQQKTLPNEEEEAPAPGGGGSRPLLHKRPAIAGCFRKHIGRSFAV